MPVGFVGGEGPYGMLGHIALRLLKLKPLRIGQGAMAAPGYRPREYDAGAFKNLATKKPTARMSWIPRFCQPQTTDSCGGKSSVKSLLQHLDVSFE